MADEQQKKACKRQPSFEMSFRNKLNIVPDTTYILKKFNTIN